LATHIAAPSAPPSVEFFADVAAMQLAIFCSRDLSVIGQKVLARAPLQSRCALRIWDLPAPTLELAKAIALLSIRMKRCATNDAWADARLSLDQASDMPLQIFFLAEAAMEDPYETLGVERNASMGGRRCEIASVMVRISDLTQTSRDFRDAKAGSRQLLRQGS
jgi:hypothetical protein